MAMFVVLSKISLFLIFKFHLETRTCLFLQLKTDILEKIFQDVQDIIIASSGSAPPDCHPHMLAVRTCTPKCLARPTVHFKNSECFWGGGGHQSCDSFLLTD